ncbi:MAG TPA: LpqB family beta-propeller domain-containing protein [Jatrophihabitans sp.]|uniref:LpqB family beta-propeller domain-containing protein n=1 Tax=Jatrophihabitans sp. TaxID=1932789 RepID=UPI002DFD74A7|nr:LpqB family beta-propeller domain-containing protein [Jatrophihabitans sp.]
MTPARPRLLVLAVAVATALTGCTSIPGSSAPETIKPVELGNGGAPSITPPPNDVQPRDLVLAFLAASASAAAGSAQPRAFLAGDARVKWTPMSKVTILDGGTESVSTYQADRSEVVVRGRAVGTLNNAGVYTPNPQGSSPAGPYTYHLVKVRGQYRIDGLSGGLVLTTDEFQQAFKQRSLYFYDLAGKYLVPDQRWTADSGLPLERWLLNQLANGPRPELQNAVNSDTLPNQQVPSRLTVTSGAVTRVEIPGSSQLDSEARYRLAAQVAQTFEGVSAGLTLEITDGGDAVPITSNATQFTGSQFVDALGPTPPAPDVYFLRGGRIYGENNEPLAGAVNSSGPLLTAIAMRQPSPSAALAIAGLTGTGSSRRLYIGSQFGGLARTSVHGTLSRPAWAPGLGEVWVGQGRGLMRVPVEANGRAAAPIPVALPAVAGATRIVALRFSPEGTRLALVIATATGTQQLYLGAIVRSAGQVRVDTLTTPPLSPPGVIISDVAWPQAMKLFAIGYNASNFDSRIFETDVDGAAFNARPIGLLPLAPDSVTAAPGRPAWVSADGAVWEQSGSSWQSPDGTGQRNGGMPIYLE